MIKINIKINNKKSGFTLLELLVAITISAVVITVAYSLINSSIKFYNRESSNIKGRNDMRVVLKWLNSDLQNTSNEDIVVGGEKNLLYKINAKGEEIRYYKVPAGKIKGREVFNIERVSNKDGKFTLLESVSDPDSVSDKGFYISIPDINDSYYKVTINVIDKFNKDNKTYLKIARRNGIKVSSVDNKVETPISNINSGVVEYGTKITLSTSTAGAEIYYTEDGSTPTIGSKKYTGPITITKNVTIKAFGVKTGLKDSDVAVFDYKIKAVGGDPNKPYIDINNDGFTPGVDYNPVIYNGYYNSQGDSKYKGGPLVFPTDYGWYTGDLGAAVSLNIMVQDGVVVKGTLSTQGNGDINFMTIGDVKFIEGGGIDSKKDLTIQTVGSVIIEKGSILSSAKDMSIAATEDLLAEGAKIYAGNSNSISFLIGRGINLKNSDVYVKNGSINLTANLDIHVEGASLSAGKHDPINITTSSGKIYTRDTVFDGIVNIIGPRIN